jgi:hypothetical protein
MDITIYRKKVKNQDDSIESKIVGFFREYPNPADDQVHNFAKELNIDPSQLEAKIYQLISCIISGGKSKGRTDFNPDQLAKGLAVEMEHVDEMNPFAELIAEKISKDHLSEMDDYYDKLAMIEKQQ